ncbi:MAG: recombination protein RecR [Chloroflexi bacterium]|nr:recombination protein RecR [Chloroflexota bacterium]
MSQSKLPAPIARLRDELARLPGVGPKTASRLVFFLLRAPEEQALSLSEAILALKSQVVTCSVCQNIAEHDPCAICGDEGRDRRLICVVEEPLDVWAIERTGAYSGVYHVLHGVLSPLERMGPDELRIRELVARVRGGQVEEVILATNPSFEGEATAMYLRQQLEPLAVRVTRLARGLPMGGDLEYADEVTLARSLEGRRPL